MVNLVSSLFGFGHCENLLFRYLTPKAQTRNQNHCSVKATQTSKIGPRRTWNTDQPWNGRYVKAQSNMRCPILPASLIYWKGLNKLITFLTCLLVWDDIIVCKMIFQSCKVGYTSSYILTRLSNFEPAQHLGLLVLLAKDLLLSSKETLSNLGHSLAALQSW